ncbi:hypothetical protein MKX03_014862 [Papaver bracteatum]|nr:hypothetical protein MKX03_014862 [Papaver bracteatum]
MIFFFVLSKSRMASQDSFSGCEAHILCVNRYGFFGTVANMNLCSKCYRDQLKADEQSILAKSAFEKYANPKKVLTSQAESVGSSHSSVAYETTSSPSSASSDSATSSSNRESCANRCFSCNKKLGLTAIKCKCGPVFCSAHRYPEKHSCEFNYKVFGRESLAKLNPQVMADKMIDRF